MSTILILILSRSLSTKAQGELDIDLFNNKELDFAPEPKPEGSGSLTKTIAEDNQEPYDYPDPEYTYEYTYKYTYKYSYKYSYEDPINSGRVNRIEWEAESPTTSPGLTSVPEVGIPTTVVDGGVVAPVFSKLSCQSKNPNSLGFDIPKYAPIIRIGWKAFLFVSIASLVLYAGYGSFDWLITGFMSEFLSWLGACEITPTTVLLGQVSAAFIYWLYTFVLIPVISWFENLLFKHGSKLLTKSSPQG